MEVVKLKLDFDNIRDLIRKYNNSEHGKDDNPIILFPSDVNNIANKVLEMHKNEVLPQANVSSQVCPVCKEHKLWQGFERCLDCFNKGKC